MGLGYIGLPTASILANKGYHVFGVDVRPDVVETINRGQIHIEEPDLDILVRSAVNSGQLKAGLEPQPADIFIICVPTPINPDHSPDLSLRRASFARHPTTRPRRQPDYSRIDQPAAHDRRHRAALRRA